MRFAAALAALTAAAVPVIPVAFSENMFGQPIRAAQAPSNVCVIDDPRAIELSGLIAAPTGYIAINDSQDNADNIRIIYLSNACKVTNTVRYPSSARDPEDVAVAPDGTVWVADIGDNVTSQTRRSSIALWKVPASGAPIVHRMTYPDGPHDAEALLFGGNGIPVIVTKEPSGKAGLYQPTGPLQPQSATGVPLKRVGEFMPRSTGENNLLGVLGETMVTGAATSPDRHRIALRTYTAAYEWDVPDGDVVKAITKTIPRLTALPDEPQGESICYSADGKTFLTVSDQAGPTTMRSNTPSTQPLAIPTVSASASPAAAPPPTGLAALPIWISVAAGVGGMALLVLGIVGVRRNRKESHEMPAASV